MITGWASSFLAHGLFYVALVAGEWSCHATLDRVLFPKPRPAREVRRESAGCANLDFVLARGQLRLKVLVCVRSPSFTPPSDDARTLRRFSGLTSTPYILTSRPRPILRSPPASFHHVSKLTF